MRILNIHVENFGKLSQFNYSFSSGLNTIYEENGFGKTTLATFIKVMLYGFTRTSSQNININERKKYEPWSGGKYGGYLEFEYQNTQYRVTRFFGKSLTKDTFSIFDLTHHTDKTCFSENLGEELFRLDVDSFTRCTYLPQNLDKGNYATTSIHAKLSHLIEDTNDINNYDLAIQKLKEKRTEIKKYRGNGGISSNLEEQLISLETKLSKINHDKSLYESYQEELDKLTSELDKIKEELKNARKDIYRIPELEIQRNKVDELNYKIANNQKQLDILNQRYKEGYPSEEELSELKKESSILAFNEYRLNEIKDKQISLEQEKELSNDIHRLQEMLNLYQDDFHQELPSEKDMDTCLKIIEDYEAKQVKRHNQYHYCLILSIVLLIGILYSFYRQSLIVTVILVLLEILSIISYVFLKKKVTQEKNKNHEVIAKEKEQLISFFEYYLPSSSHVSFKKDYEELIALKNKKVVNQNENEKLKTEIQSILNDYQVKDIDELQQKYHFYMMNKEEIQNRIEQNERINAYIESFKQKYHLDDEENIDEHVLKDIQTKDILVQQMTEYRKEKEEYLKDNPDIELTNLNTETCNNHENELEEKRLQLNEQMNQLKYQMDNCIKNICQENDVLAEYRKLLDEKNEYENKCIILDKTIEYLSRAKENLASLYIRKIENYFMKYSHQILGNELNQTKLDTSLNVYIEESGDLKKMNYYSTGMIGCIDLCMRLALIDALFEKEQPFIVLDDSFVDFDDMHLSKALDLIKEVSKNKQIIYFVCHSSRC